MPIVQGLLQLKTGFRRLKVVHSGAHTSPIADVS